jgi:hypothetical protein
MKPDWKQAAIIELRASKMELANLHNLADELIEFRCGRHSVGNLYEYLLKAYGDANRAKADFIRFLSGELPARMVRTASAWISEEQGDERDPERHNGHAVSLGRETVSVGFTGIQA